MAERKQLMDQINENGLQLKDFSTKASSKNSEVQSLQDQIEKMREEFSNQRKQGFEEKTTLQTQLN